MTFYFYDLETSSGRPRDGRIMQFAGIRTDENMQIIGEPDDILVKLAPDVLPEPDAVLVHGITPQKANEDGLSEVEFCRYFQEKVATADTVFVGFNNIRFDDEFMRYTLYRNFYEPYEWQWKDGRSRFDMMDMLRMMRALRPDGIEWPVNEDGSPTVKLTAMTAANGLDHENAHTAIADVQATVALAQLVHEKQGKLFDYLLKMRGKRDVAALVEAGAPFVYTSGRYPSEYLKTTLVHMLFKKPKRDAAIVYDLRIDPTPFFAMSVEELTAAWSRKYGEEGVRLPVKALQYNHCPAIAPQSVLDGPTSSWERLQLSKTETAQHLQLLKDHPEFVDRLGQALGIMDDKQTALQLEVEAPHVDTQLYDSFWNDYDRGLLVKVREHSPATLGEVLPKLTNKRMQKLLPLYKARNYAEFLTPEERDAWEVYRQERFYKGGEDSYAARFMKRLSQLSTERSSSRDQYLLTELQLYVESILPEME